MYNYLSIKLASVAPGYDLSNIPDYYYRIRIKNIKPWTAGKRYAEKVYAKQEALRQQALKHNSLEIPNQQISFIRQ